ncbi:MAG: ROK family protein [Solobacterium sp.]|nr:ROK family protein [Solobacterium sp.]
MKKYLVFDIGGTAIKFSVMNDAAEMLESGQIPTPRDNQEHFLADLKTIYDQFGEDCEGIAISLPGLTDSDRGYMITGGALSYNVGQYVAKQISEMCEGKPVHLENDGKAAAWAEMESGALKGIENGSVFIIGTGVAGGLILNGKLFKGKDFSAGEYSYLNVNDEKWGQFSTMMGSRCSTTGLLGIYRDLKGMTPEEELNGRDFFNAYDLNDPAAHEALETFARYVAVQLFNLTMLLDIERFAIGGGISNHPALVETIRKAYHDIHFDSEFPLDNTPIAEIIKCRYGSEANQIGALYSMLEYNSRMK